MFDEIIDSLDLIATQTKANYSVLAMIALLLCVFYILIVLSGRRLLLLGIMPRRIHGLLGIIFAPLLHAHFNHLFFNLIPLLILSNFILIGGLELFIWASAMIILLSGFLIWCFGRNNLHVGASALVTGYWGFLVSNILQQGTFTAIILGLISVYYFAGIFFGIFPGRKGVSWEGHLFGLIAGIVASQLLFGATQ